MGRSLAAIAFLFALASGVYWKLTFSDKYTWLENPDQAFQIRPWLDYPARELHAGRIPLWDPYQVGGQTLIGQVVPGAANPFNWILFAMPLRDGHIPVRTLHWYWVLIHWVAAAFAYWMCRDLGASHMLAILGAAIFAFTGFMGHATTPQYLLSAVWIPVILLFFARVWRGQRPLVSAAQCGAAMGAAFLSGHHNVPIYMAVTIGILWVWLIVRRWLIVPAAVFGVFVLLVSAFQVLPAVEFGRQSLRWGGATEPQRWNEAIPYSVHAEYSIGTSAIWGLAIPGGGMHAEPLVGVTALALAVSATALGWRKSHVRLLMIVACSGLVLALGRDTPIHRIFYEWVPLVEKARFPAMAIVICQAGIAGLAACARYLRPWSAAALLALVLIELFTFPVLLQPRGGPGSYEATIAAQSDIAEFLHRQPGWFRVDFDENVVPYNFGDWHGIEQYNGYVAAMTERFHGRVGNESAPRSYGIQYRVGNAPSHPGQIEVFQSRSGAKVFRDPRVGPPLWSIHETPCPEADRLRVIGRLPGASTFEADMACRGLMVVGDTFYRGWRAYVDGRRVPIQEVDAGRAVVVPEGRHRIEFRYRPVPVYVGAALTALGLVFTAVLTFRK